MSWSKKVVAVVADLFAWFWLGIVPGWYRPRRTVNILTPTRTIPAVKTGAGTLLFDRRSIVPVSPAAPTAEMLLQEKLGPRQRTLPDSPPPVDTHADEQVRISGRVPASAIDSPTALLRVLDPENVDHVENPCVACGKESTSALLDRCAEHDQQILLVATTVPAVPPSLGWITGHTTGEFEKLLEDELARTLRR
jgi:hypothetical protein